MALKSTIYKVNIAVSDLNRELYQDYQLTTARHPSETEERLACRIIAFALNSHDELVFAKGLSDDQEPDLWQKSLDGRILKWIEIGQPDEKRLRKLSGKSESLSIYCYQINAAEVWWENIKKHALKLPKLSISFLKMTNDSSINTIIDRSMDLNCVIEDSTILISSNKDDTKSVSLEVEQIK